MLGSTDGAGWVARQHLSGDEIVEEHRKCREVLLDARGREPAAIPHQKAEPGRDGPFDREAYRQRNLIERGMNRLKWLRRIATRYEKLAIHYLALLKLAILFRFYLG